MTYSEQQALMLQSIEDGFRAGQTPSTLVEMSKTYATDTDLCLSNVVFVPDLAMNGGVRELVEQLRMIDADQYLYPTASLHTTMKNVRTVHAPPLFTEEDIERLRPVLRQVASRYLPFEIEWRGLLALPTSLAIKGTSSEMYGSLVNDLHQALIDGGVPDNKKYASETVFAHISTICRYTHAPSVVWEEVVGRWKDASFGASPVESFSLVVCNAAAAPNSLRVVETFPFRKT